MAELELSPMFPSLSEIFRSVVPGGLTGLGFNGWPKLLERADSGLEIGEALRAVVSVLEYLKRSSPVSLVPATKILADGSRYGKLFQSSSDGRTTTEAPN